MDRLAGVMRGVPTTDLCNIIFPCNVVKLFAPFVDLVHDVVPGLGATEGDCYFLAKSLALSRVSLLADGVPRLCSTRSSLSHPAPCRQDILLVPR